MIVKKHNCDLLDEILKTKHLNQLMQEKLSILTVYSEENDEDEITQDKEIVENCRGQFTISETDPNRYELTLLGFINGILPELTGKVLVQNIDDDNNVTGYDVVEKWW